MTISAKDKKLLLIFVGVLAVVLSFIYVYQPVQEENEELTIEISQRRTELIRLQGLQAKEDEYVAETKELEEQVTDIFNKFPAELKTEDLVMVALELEEDTAADITAADFETGTLVYEWGKGTVTEESTEETVVSESDAVEDDSSKQLFGTKVTLEFTSTYSQAKEIIDYINESEERRTINTVELSYDNETGGLTGIVEFTMYSLTGTDAVYTEPDIPTMNIGTDDIFGSIDIASGE